MKLNSTLTPLREANQTVRLDLGSKDGVQSMRIGFTDQRLTAHGGLAVWTGFITVSDRPETTYASAKRFGSMSQW